MFWNNKTNKTEAKSSYSTFVTLADPALANWLTDAPGALEDAGFRNNPVSYRCIRMIAEAAASIPVQCDVAEASELGRLLATPVTGETLQSLLEGVYGDLQVNGNAFLELVPGTDDSYAGLQRVPPASVRPLERETGWSIRSRSGQRAVRPDATGWSRILHFRSLDPSMRKLAMSPLVAARRSVEIHNSGSDWAKSLIDNAARPSGALVYGRDGAHLTPDQFTRLKEQLEDAHTGARNAGRPMLLEGGLEWKPMGLTPSDMDFIDARRESAREIALAFGVPPMLLGIPGDNTYSNYKEANLAFWRLTVLPLVRRTLAAMEAWLSQAGSGEAVCLRPDLDAVAALGPEREALWNHLIAADFLTKDEKRAMAGLPPREVRHAD